MRAAIRLRNEKARRRFRRGLSNFLRWCQYAGDLPDESNLMKMRQINCGQSKPDLQACVAQMKKPAAESRRGLYSP